MEIRIVSDAKTIAEWAGQCNQKDLDEAPASICAEEMEIALDEAEKGLMDLVIQGKITVRWEN
jgi:hypothetical protein